MSELTELRAISARMNGESIYQFEEKKYTKEDGIKVAINSCQNMMKLLDHMTNDIGATKNYPIIAEYISKIILPAIKVSQDVVYGWCSNCNNMSPENLTIYRAMILCDDCLKIENEKEEIEK